jgi:hypothetical protein
MQVDPVSNRLVLSAARSIECESPNVTLAHNGKLFPVARERTDYDLNFQVTRSEKNVLQKKKLSFCVPCDSCPSGSTFQRRVKGSGAGSRPALFLSAFNRGMIAG